jgi:hypothetical protein
MCAKNEHGRGNAAVAQALIIRGLTQSLRAGGTYMPAPGLSKGTGGETAALPKSRRRYWVKAGVSPSAWIFFTTSAITQSGVDAPAATPTTSQPSNQLESTSSAVST